MILGIDTATRTCSLGLFEGSTGIIGEISLKMDRGHGRFMNQVLQDLMNMVNRNPEDIKGVAVGLGPGSYTGTRVGIAAARALTLALEIPAWGVSTLEALARGLPRSDMPILTALDARRQRVYWGLYRNKGDSTEKLIAAGLNGIEEVVKEILKAYPQVILLGELPASYVQIFENLLGEKLEVGPEPFHQVRGAIVACMGWHAHKTSPGGDNITRLVPTYLGKPANLG